jgi:Fe-S-cluster containining protein
MIEADKARALDAHDFGAYPQLSGKRFYRPAADGRAGFFDLAKGEGTRCLFLDHDGLCIIHKELGPDAKPAMCRQFPFLPSRTWTDDRVSVNYGCPSAQASRGAALADQRGQIEASTPRSQRPHKGAGVNVRLDRTRTIRHSEYESLMERCMAIFGAAESGSVWSRFAKVLDSLDSWPADGAADDDRKASADEVIAPANRSALPMPSRLLFASTLYPDTLPSEPTGKVGLVKRLMLLPRLMSLGQLTGVYASRICGRNIDVDAVLRHEVRPDLAAGATALLLRYFRSRFWQRMIVGTRLPVVAGVHQHILDFGAIVFLSRAQAAHRNEAVIDESSVRRALTGVEFHLANQARVHEQTLKGWFISNLCNLELARSSLRLMALRTAGEAAAAASFSS